MSRSGAPARWPCTRAGAVDQRVHRRVGDHVEERLRVGRDDLGHRDQVAEHVSSLPDTVARCGPWPSTAVPLLPGTGDRLRLHDTATGTVRPTEPGPTATMYVCGITPYDATHLGHAATYLAFDLVQRRLARRRARVHYVQNVTDVDDPLLERAAHDGEDWAALAAREIELFRADMTALRVLPPQDYVGVVEAVPRDRACHRGRCSTSGAAYRVDQRHLLRGQRDRPLRRRVRLRPRHHARAVRRARRRPGAGRASATRWTRCCGARAGPASRPGTPSSGRAGRDGTSSAR